MSIYNDSTSKGDVFVRKIDGSINTSSNFLSSIFIKYQNINTFFYDDLIENNIKNIDMFYDVIFIETVTGYTFEKFITDIYNNVYPYNNENLFTAINNTSPAYWFDDKKLKIYIVDIISGFQTNQSFSFYVKLKEFDCKTGKLFIKLSDQISFNGSNSSDWGSFIPPIEKPVFTYNEYTTNFNLSFIFRNKKNNIGIVSINLSHIEEFNIEKINLYCPFLNVVNTVHISL